MSSPHRSISPPARNWILWLVVATCFLGLANRGLLVPDEAREAAILLDAAERRDFVVPHLADEPFIEKPPLYYATGAFVHDALSPFASVETVALATSALFGLGLLLAVWVLAHRWLDAERARLAFLLFGVSTAFLEHSHYIRCDIALACMVAAAVASFSEAYLGGRRGALVLGGVFTGLALLAKGLVGPAMIAPAWLALFVWRGKSESSRFGAQQLLWHAAALVAFCATCVPWMWALYVRDEALWTAWFYDNQLGRAAGTAGLGHDDAAKPWFYLWTMLGDALPWTPLLLCWPILAFRAWRQGRGRRIDAHLATWIAGVMLLLTAASTKRNLYLLPLLPAFALAAASAWPASLSRRLETVLRSGPFVALAGCAALALGPLFLDRPSPRASHWLHFVPLPGSTAHLFAIGLSVLALAAIVFRRRLPALETALVATLLVNWLALETALPSVATYGDPRVEIARVRSALAAQSDAYASYELGEMQRGWLFLYSSLTFDPVSLERAREILRNGDPRYRGVLVGKKRNLELLQVPYRVALQVDLDVAGHNNNAINVLEPVAPSQQVADPAPLRGRTLSVHH